MTEKAPQNEVLSRITIKPGSPDMVIPDEQLAILADHFVKHVYPAEWYEHQFERNKGRLQKVAQNPNTVLFFDGEKCVGLGGWKELGVSNKDGAAVVEFGPTVTDPTYENSGLASMMGYKSLQSVETAYGDNPVKIIVVSHSQAVLHMVSALGYLPVDMKSLFEEYNDVRLDDLDILNKEGYQAYVLSLNEPEPFALSGWKQKIHAKVTQCLADETSN